MMGTNQKINRHALSQKTGKLTELTSASNSTNEPLRNVVLYPTYTHRREVTQYILRLTDLLYDFRP